MPEFQAKLAENEAEVLAAQRLRYAVFVEELGGDGDGVDHDQKLEKDRFDRFAQHLLLLDRERPAGDQVVGVYRLMGSDNAEQAGQYYSESEFDLSVLKASGRSLLELGRSCLHQDYRGGTAMYELWSGLSAYVKEHRVEVLFGVASFHGTDPGEWAHALSLLHHRHLAPPELRVTAHGSERCEMGTIPAESLDRRAAMVSVPALIKAYLRLGGYVGDGAWVDREFNTIDVCLVMDTARMNAQRRAMYSGGPRP